MIGIRADGNSEIATGHIIRCLAIANGLKDIGCDCVFIVADDNSADLLLSSGFEIITLHSVWNDLDKEITALTNIIDENKIEKLIVDSYFVTEKYLSSLEEHCRVIYIDDLNIFRYPVSFLINYNLYEKYIPYSEIYAGTKTKYLLGPKYAPLRPEFKNHVRKSRDKVEKILITVGGVDIYNVADIILEKVVTDDYFKGIDFHVVAGKLNSHLNELKQIAKKYPQIKIHQDVKRMSDLMLDSDISVTAGGSTMYELCACGLPSVCLSVAANQLMAVKAFSDKGLMEYAGDIRYGADECISRVVVGLKKYMGDFAMRSRCGKEMSELVDGQGVKNICEILSTI